MWFSTDPHSQAAMYPLGVERVREIIRANQKGRKVEQLDDSTRPLQQEEPTFADVVGEESLTRFDRQKEGRRKNRKKKNKPAGKEASSGSQPQNKSGNVNAHPETESNGRNTGRKATARPEAKKDTDTSAKQSRATAQGAGTQSRPENGGSPDRRKEGGARRNNNNRRRRNPHANNGEKQNAGQTNERSRKPSGE